MGKKLSEADAKHQEKGIGSDQRVFLRTDVTDRIELETTDTIKK